MIINNGLCFMNQNLSNILGSVASIERKLTIYDFALGGKNLTIEFS